MIIQAKPVSSLFQKIILCLSRDFTAVLIGSRLYNTTKGTIHVGVYAITLDRSLTRRFGSLVFKRLPRKDGRQVLMHKNNEKSTQKYPAYKVLKGRYISDCGTLTAPTNGDVSYSTGTVWQSEATFICDVGYTLSTTTTRVCQSDAAWNNADPTCIINGIHSFQIVRLTLCLLFSTPDNICKQFGSRLGPTF